MGKSLIDDKEMSVAGILEKDQERQIQGVDIGDEQSFSHVIRRAEEDHELEEIQGIDKKARANKG
jgi:hypothetical protein